MKQLTEKIKKTPQKVLQLPHSIMSRYANQQHQTASDFGRMYALPVFVGAVACLVMAYVGWCVDYEVLYGIEYNAHQDQARAEWHAFQTATIIQLLIVFFFSIGAKALLFGKVIQFEGIKPQLVNKGHAIMFVLCAGLFYYGFSWTLELSYKTYHSAKANAAQFERNTKAKFAQNAENLKLEQQKAIEAVQNTIQDQKNALQAKYGTEKDDLTKLYLGKIERKKAKYQKGQISKAILLDKTTKYTNSMNAGVKTINTELNDKLLHLTNQEAEQIEAINSQYTTLLSKNDNNQVAALAVIAQDIEANAQATAGRNVRINSTSVILSLLTVFYALFAGKDNSTTTATQDTDTTNAGTARKRKKKKKKKKAYTAKATTTVQTYTDNQKTTSTTNGATLHKLTQKQPTQETKKEVVETSTAVAVQEDIQTIEGHEVLTVEGLKPKVLHNGKFVLASQIKSWMGTARSRANKYLKEGKTELVQYQNKVIADFQSKLNALNTVK
jgi:hypothetical protein